MARGFPQLSPKPADTVASASSGPFHAWEIPDHLDEVRIAHLVFLFEDGDRIEPHEYHLSFRPFTLGELRERLELAGLREVDTDHSEAADRYAVIAAAA